MHQHSPAEPLTLATVLLLESDMAQANAVASALVDEPYQVVIVSSIAEAMLALSKEMVDVVLADHGLVAHADNELFELLRTSHPAVIRILLATDRTVNSAKRAVQSGWAHHYLHATRDHSEIALVLYNTLVQRSFLPPESEGVLPSPELKSSIAPSR
ncbi:MAG TPA: response regulator [Polyangiaceae bacterium]